MNRNEFLQLSRKIWGNLYDYTYVDFSKRKKEKQIVICSYHGPFDVSLSDHFGKRKIGCKTCGRQRTGIINSIKRAISHEDFITACKLKHNNQYDYQHTIYDGALKMISVGCPVHGLFSVRSDRHKSGQGCQNCMRELRTSQKFLSKKEWLERCLSTHDVEYDYSESIYSGTENKVKIICKHHGAFEQNAGHHMRGSDCPKCTRKSSKISLEWLKSLDNDHLVFEYFLPEIRRYADAYDKKSRTVYLFHGDYWHGNPTVFPSDAINPTIGLTYGHLYEKTKKSEKMIIDAGYQLITMWEKDWITYRSSLSARQP